MLSPDALHSPASAKLIQSIDTSLARAASTLGVFQFFVSEHEPQLTSSRLGARSRLVHRGVAADAVANFNNSDSDLAAMIASQLQPEKAWKNNQLKIVGNEFAGFVWLSVIVRCK
jgi:hypothetical protein